MALTLYSNSPAQYLKLQEGQATTEPDLLLYVDAVGERRGPVRIFQFTEVLCSSVIPTMSLSTLLM